jgi:hypothetical protein
MVDAILADVRARRLSKISVRMSSEVKGSVWCMRLRAKKLEF